MQTEIFAEGEGLSDVEVFEMAEGASVQDIIAAVAKKCGYAAEDAALFLDEEDEPLELLRVLTKDELKGRVPHVHRVKQITVVVFYKDGERKRDFRPSAPFKRVLRWAGGREGFNIDPAIAPEMELAR